MPGKTRFEKVDDNKIREVIQEIDISKLKVGKEQLEQEIRLMKEQTEEQIERLQEQMKLIEETLKEAKKLGIDTSEPKEKKDDSHSN